MKQVARSIQFLILCGSFAAAYGQAPRRQIDVGAENAPLTDTQRESLAAAVNVHNFAAERSILIEAIAASPKSADLYAVLGRLAFLEKHPADAASAFEQADGLRSLGQKDREMMALSYAFSHQSEKARAQLQRLEREAPAKADYPYMLGRVEEQTGALEAAVEQYKHAIALDKGNLPAYQQLGGCLERLGQTEAARLAYEEAYRANQTRQNPSPWPPLNLGASYEQLGKLAEAEKYTREAISYGPNMSQAHYRLGMVLEKESKYNDALEEFRKATTEDRFYPPAYLALGRICEKLGKKEEAQQAVARFRELKGETNSNGSPQK